MTSPFGGPPGGANSTLQSRLSDRPRPQGSGADFLDNPPGSPGLGGGGSLTTRVVSLATSRLKPVVDPLAQILSQLHKVCCVCVLRVCVWGGGGGGGGGL